MYSKAGPIITSSDHIDLEDAPKQGHGSAAYNLEVSAGQSGAPL